VFHPFRFVVSFRPGKADDFRQQHFSKLMPQR
jgi:hypothetical protein